MNSFALPFYGVLDLPWWGYVVVTLVFAQISIACVTLFLHRAQAHRGLELHPIVSHFFRFWLWMTTGMVTKAWVAIHRKHHAKCETAEDPHSPQVLGLATVLWQGTELYRRGARDAEALARYGAGTPDDWIERQVYTKHSALGIMLMLALNLVLFGIPGMIIWAIQMGWMPFFAAGIINGVGHYWGYRNFDCPDAGRNITPIAFFVGGEELHNNHHAYPTSCKFSIRPWEFDIGWLYIRLLQTVGLAYPKRVAPMAMPPVSGRSYIEPETLGVLIANRFQVMAHYTKQVLLPVWKAEMRAAREKGAQSVVDLLHFAKKGLVREALIHSSDFARQRFDHALSSAQSLAQVYQLRTALQAIWDRTSATQKDLVEALHQWCVEAEASGEKALAEFSAYLKGFSVRHLV